MSKELQEQHEEFERFTKMNTEELAAATAEYEQEFVEDKFRALTPSERQQWLRAKRRGRPVVGKGAKKISISIEADHLSLIDRCAELLNISRSKLLTDGAVMLAKANGIVTKKDGRLSRGKASKNAGAASGKAKQPGRRRTGS